MSGFYDGGNGPADASGWQQPVASSKDGEPHPEPKGSYATVQETKFGEREVTPDPYTSGNPHVHRNFGNT